MQIYSSSDRYTTEFDVYRFKDTIGAQHIVYKI